VGVDDRPYICGFSIERQVKGPLLAGLLVPYRCAVHPDCSEIFPAHGAETGTAGADINQVIVPETHICGRTSGLSAFKQAVGSPYGCFQFFY